MHYHRLLKLVVSNSPLLEARLGVFRMWGVYTGKKLSGHSGGLIEYRTFRSDIMGYRVANC